MDESDVSVALAVVLLLDQIDKQQHEISELRDRMYVLQQQFDDLKEQQKCKP